MRVQEQSRFSGLSPRGLKSNGKNATWTSFTEKFSPYANVPFGARAQDFEPQLQLDPEAESFGADIVAGLSNSPKRISSRWFYDSEGSRLFSKITELEEYYPTEAEASILRKESGAIADAMQGHRWIVTELGAGDGRKTEILLAKLLERGIDVEFWPIDLSGAALDALCARMQAKLPQLKCNPILADNRDGLRELAFNRGDRRALVLFLGSSIGNGPRMEVFRFLHELRSSLTNGDMTLIGFDLVKCKERLMRAYSDSQGVTREFNLNLLSRMNRELGADFDLDAFAHEATWNPWIRGMESWLVSQKDQAVYFAGLGRVFHFRKWEPVHTEISLKFEPLEIGEMAGVSGFSPLTLLVDERNDFADALWRIDR